MKQLRVFLDANILFAIANRPTGHLSRLLSLTALRLVSSDYAFQEAAENLAAYASEALPEFDRLEKLVTVTDRIAPLPSWVVLQEEDRRILAAAIGAQCDYPISYDRDFDPLFGKTVECVKVEHAGAFLRQYL